MSLRAALVFLVVFSLPWFEPGIVAAEDTDEEPSCVGRSLLVGVLPGVRGRIVGDVRVASDGWLVPEGRTPTRLDSLELGPGASLEFRFSAPETATSIYLQGAAAAYFVVETDAPAGSESLFEAAPVEGRGERGRGTIFRARPLTILRVRNPSNTPATLSEVGLFACGSDLDEAGRYTRLRPDEDPGARRTDRANATKLAFGLLALVILLGVTPRMRPSAARATEVMLLVLSAFAWLEFGSVADLPRGPLHYWDSLHYFVGSRYAPEVGYDELYDCIGASAYRRGLGDWFSRGVMRRLEDNVRVPAVEASPSRQRCRHLGPASQRRLDRDLTALARLPLPFGMRPEGITNDRGYLGSPFGTAWLRLASSWAPPTRKTFVVLALVDFVALIAAFGVLARTAGVRAATFAALAFAIGHPWDFDWLGGAFDRHTGLLALSLALLGLERRAPLIAGAALAFLALHRVFPVLFVVAAVAFALRGGAIGDVFPRRLAAATAGFAAAFVALSAAFSGRAGWIPFIRRLAQHGDVPVANELGGPSALRAFSAGIDRALDAGQLDPLVPWQVRIHEVDVDRLPLRLALAGLAAALLVVLFRTRAHPARGAFAALLLTLVVSDVASYYGPFVLFAACLPGLAERRRIAFVAVAIATQVVMVLPALDTLDRYGLISWALLGTLALAVTLPSDSSDDADGDRTHTRGDVTPTPGPRPTGA